MPSQLDLDQGGTVRQTQKVYMGPSVGWVIVPVTVILPVNAAGITTVLLGTTLVLVNVNAAVTIQLPSAKDAGVPAIGLSGPYVKTQITIVDIGGFAQAHPITILPAAGETIMGLASISLSVNYGGYTLSPSNAQQGWTSISP